MSATILIIDDSDRIREEVRRLLVGEGFDVLEAVDGLDGLEKLRARADLALALCDVNMPRLTGVELLAELSKQPTATPILMLTTEGQQTMIRQARAYGARGWIIKPFKPDLLLGAVRKIVGARG